MWEQGTNLKKKINGRIWRTYWFENESKKKFEADEGMEVDEVNLKMRSLKIEDSDEDLNTWNNITTNQPEDSDEPEDAKLEEAKRKDVWMDEGWNKRTWRLKVEVK